jgi:hypothetical protein
MADIFEDNSWVLPYRSPWLTSVFYVLTQFGNLEVLVLLLPLAYWLLRRRFFTRFILLLLFTVTFDGLLKEVLQDPRPDPANIIGEGLVGTFSFPSDHVALATAYWSLLAFELQRWWVTVTTIAIILAVGASRLYMGMHDLDDVPPSIAIGWLIALALHHAQPLVARLVNDTPRRTLILAATLATPLALLGSFAGLSPSDYGLGLLAFLVAWAAGEIWDRDILAFQPSTDTPRAVFAATIGLALVAVIVVASHDALSILDAPNTLILALELLLVSLFASLVTPPLFRALRLAA